ncbi:MAG: DUF1016 family protein [Gammaproteobacteria bacterium]|nr:DUF1016 family protein [Gammaproteobacteria bacterium]MCW5582607.1 DUF1016 family protein [Gammaproteobacteria bacterium]
MYNNCAIITKKLTKENGLDQCMTLTIRGRFSLFRWIESDYLSVKEADIENRIVDKIKTVMLELGFGFSFIGSQYRIAAKGRGYFIDLLFYNRRMQSLVAFEIKKGRFEPEYAGKMNFYLNLLDDFVREPHENPSIGIIPCSERNHFEVEYVLRGVRSPVGVAEFRLPKSLPKEFSDKPPDPKNLEQGIKRELEKDAIEEVELNSEMG